MEKKVHKFKSNLSHPVLGGFKEKPEVHDNKLKLMLGFKFKKLIEIGADKRK